MGPKEGESCQKKELGKSFNTKKKLIQKELCEEKRFLKKVIKEEEFD